MTQRVTSMDSPAPIYLFSRKNHFSWNTDLYERKNKYFKKMLQVDDVTNKLYINSLRKISKKYVIRRIEQAGKANKFRGKEK